MEIDKVLSENEEGILNILYAILQLILRVIRKGNSGSLHTNEFNKMELQLSNSISLLVELHETLSRKKELFLFYSQVDKDIYFNGSFSATKKRELGPLIESFSYKIAEWQFYNPYYRNKVQENINRLRRFYD